MKRLILSQENREKFPNFIIEMMDFVLIEDPPIYFIEKNRLGGITGEVTYDEAVRILEELQEEFI